jgi:hypothetical protein
MLILSSLVDSQTRMLSENQVDPKTVSSDGYMANLHVVLLKLFEPVIDVTYSKVSSPHSDMRSLTLNCVCRSTKLIPSISNRPRESTSRRKPKSKLRKRKRMPISTAVWTVSYQCLIQCCVSDT